MAQSNLPGNELRDLIEKEEIVKKYQEMQFNLRQLKRSYKDVCEAYHSLASAFGTDITNHTAGVPFEQCSDKICKSFVLNLTNLD